MERAIKLTSKCFISSLPTLLWAEKKENSFSFEMAQERLSLGFKVLDFLFNSSFQFSAVLFYILKRIVFTKFELLLGFCCKGKKWLADLNKCFLPLYYVTFLLSGKLFFPIEHLKHSFFPNKLLSLKVCSALAKDMPSLPAYEAGYRKWCSWASR